jgi:hypothetical protein
MLPNQLNRIMNKKLMIVFAVLFSLGGISAPPANAIDISIGVGDRPYYVHGPGYWNGPAYYVWVPGYWERHHHHKRWHHGYYRVHHKRWWAR